MWKKDISLEYQSSCEWVIIRKVLCSDISRRYTRRHTLVWGRTEVAGENGSESTQICNLGVKCWLGDFEIGDFKCFKCKEWRLTALEYCYSGKQYVKALRFSVAVLKNQERNMLCSSERCKLVKCCWLRDCCYWCQRSLMSTSEVIYRTWIYSTTCRNVTVCPLCFMQVRWNGTNFSLRTSFTSFC